MRRETLASWTIGAVFGVATGFMVLVGGPPLLLISLAGLALAFVAARSLALLSGAFVGVGGTWLALTVRAKQGFGGEPFLVVSTIVLAAGLVIGALAWRRRIVTTR